MITLLFGDTRGLFVLLCVFVVVPCLSRRCREELPLPSDLDQLPRYRQSRELHLHGVHRLDYTKTTNITFTIVEESFFRVYLGACKVDLDLWLFKGDARLYMSVVPYLEDNIAQKLQVGFYTIQIRPMGFDLTEEDKNPSNCHTVLFELAISPVSLTLARYANYHSCPDEPLLPMINFDPLQEGEEVSYDSDKIDQKRLLNIHGNATSSMITQYHYIKGYDFTIVPKPGTDPIFKFEATLGYHFLTGGSVRIMLVPQGNGSKPDCGWYSKSCKYGENLVSNTHSIITSLGPGNYTLWMAEMVNERLPGIPICTPISLRLNVEPSSLKENFVSCSAEPIPQSLLDPGYMDDTGYLHYRQEVLLNLTSNSHQTTFSIRTQSLFRIFVEAHRVDIDIEVSGNGTTMGRTFQGANKDESIVLELQPEVSKYIITYRYYTTIEADFCETFLLEIAIVPVLPYYQPDYCTGQLLPISNITLEGVSLPFSLPKASYHHPFTTKTHVETILIIPMLPQREATLNVNVGCSFLMGLMLSLESNHSRTPTTATTKPSGGLSLSTLLLPGISYVLSLKSGPWQSFWNTRQSNDLKHFPPCVYFDFELDLKDQLATISCGLDPVPTNLSTAQYLGTSNRIHLQQYFLVPRHSTFDSEDKMTFQVRQPSMMRAFTKLTDVDIGFSLTEDGTPLHHIVAQSGIEKMSSILSPNKTYVFIITYTADFAQLDPCVGWNFEFEIAPITIDVIEVCNNSLPPSYIWWFSSQIHEIDSVHSFTQTSSPFLTFTSFTLMEYSYFRSRVLFDFVWSNLILRLKSNDTVLAIGFNGNNRNEFPVLSLSPGDYVLEIFELEPQEQQELQRCVRFSLEIGMAPMDMSQQSALVPSSPVLCTNTDLPTTFDSIAYLSEISGNRMHFQSDILVTQTKSSTASFTVVTLSDLRIFVPNHAIDIDILLYIQNDIGATTLIASSSGFEEESIFMQLQPGSYKLTFYLHPRYTNGFAFPSDKECTTFDVEVALSPSNYTFNNLTLQSCSPPSLPTSLSPSLPTSLIVTRPAQAATMVIPFNLTREALFTASVYNVFEPGSVYLSLQGSNIVSPFVSAPSNRTWLSYQGKDFSFFDHVLWPGNYRLVLRSFGNYTFDRCTSFLLSYLVNVGNTPPYYCDDADHFPSDLYSPAGGSAFYGGPQAPDGSVRVSGTHFLLPERFSHSNILFKINATSWIRVYVSTDSSDSSSSSDKQNDIDFFVWNNASKTHLIQASLGTTNVESHLTLLEPQNEDYLLDIYIFDRSVAECVYATLELSIEPNTTAVSRLRCPSPLPSSALPPSSISITGSVRIYSTDFMFSKEFMDAHKTDYWSFKLVTYDVTLFVQGEYDFYALLGYDFTLTDFTLLLLYNSSSIAQSQYSVPGGFVNSFVDFEASLSAKLSNGTYVFRITEKIYNTRNPKEGECDRFSLLLIAEQIGGTGPVPPRILSVIPPSGSELDATYPLTMTVTFSEPVASNITQDFIQLEQWVIQNQVARLVKNQTFYLIPSNVYFNFDSTTMTLIFTDLKFDTTYSLHLNVTTLTNANSTHFSEHADTYTYSTMSCKCSDHGHCVVDAQYSKQCTCDDPYAGEECKSCQSGFHRAGVTCIANIACTKTSCKNHGTCSDDQGYPICTCYPGYENTAYDMCARCQHGFSGYPDCVPNEDDRVTTCYAPLIPNDLNTIAFLGTDGRVHIQNDYFLDIDHFSHSTSFNLTRSSYFRVYTEPHVIDLDLWLWQIVPRADGLNGETEKKMIENGLSFNDEESIFRKLDPGLYLLQIQIITMLDRNTVGNCPTFNMELEIQPTAVVDEEVKRLNEDCRATSHLPDVMVSQVPYRFDAGSKLFTLNAGDTGEQKQFYSVDFSVQKVDGKVALLQADLEYRFLVGDMAMKLQRVDTNDSNTLATGFNHRNTHHLQHFLYQGTYRLTLYTPSEVTVASCVPFSFRMTINYTNEEQDIFNCDVPQVPASLNSPPYNGNRIYLFGDFLVEERGSSIALRVPKPSSVRIAGVSQIPFHIRLKMRDQNSHMLEPVAHSEDGQLVWNTIIDDTDFRIEISYYNLDETLYFCPTIKLEIMIMRNTDILAMQPNLHCPPGRIPVLPSIPSVIEVPYIYSPPLSNDTGGLMTEQIFYTFVDYGSIVTEFNFSIDANALLDTGVASHFLNANLGIDLVTPTNKIVASKTQQEDYNAIREELGNGTYTLRIRQTHSTSENLNTIIPCIPFTFYFTLTSLDSDPDPCGYAGLIPLPTTLNSMRYLGLEGSLQIHSKKWAIPLLNYGMGSAWIPFTLKEESVLRVYVERFSVDIDVRVTTSGGERLASGSNQFGEESFIRTFDPGDYILIFQFFNWASEEPVCPGFNMQLAISPVSGLPNIIRTCKSSSFFWPSIPSSLSADERPFVYEPLDFFFYQQVDHNNFSQALQSFPFELVVAADVHVELRFNFLLGDLVLKFEGGSFSNPVFGSNEFHRNVVNLKNVPPGSYRLTIYEPTSNDPSVIGCNTFLFSMHVDLPSDVDTLVQSPKLFLPSSLNSVGYLKYTDFIHFEGEYIILQDSTVTQNQPLQVNLTKQSLVRITVDMQSPFDIEIYGAHQYPSLVALLSAVTNTLNFHLRKEVVSKDVTTNLELAVVPMDSLLGIIDRLPCKAQTTTWKPPSIQIHPSGFFQWRQKDAYLLKQQLLQEGDLYTFPFEIKNTSIVSVQLQYNFLLSDLSVVIRNKDSLLVDPSRFGTKGYNLCDLKVELSPGNYNLVLSQTTPWPSSITTTELPCSEFDLLITINPSIYSVDCSQYSLVPWDLNSEAGGSLPFGGPIRMGLLSFYFDRFLLIPGQTHIDIKFKLDQPSRLAFVLGQNNWQNMDFAVTGSDSRDNVKKALGVFNQWYQKSALYSLETGEYYMSISYDENRWDSCSSFSLGMSLAPNTVVASNLKSACSRINYQKLPTQLSIGVTEIESYFTESDLEEHKENGRFQYMINFTTQEKDIIDASISYYSLSSILMMTLYTEMTYQDNTTALIPYSYGQWDMESDNSNVDQLTQSIHFLSYIGKFVLSIEQPVIPKPDEHQSACFPFKFSFEHTTSAAGPIIRHVEPTSGSSLDPTRDLYIHIRLSEPAFDEKGEPVTRNQHMDTLASAVRLVSALNNSRHINPKQILPPITLPIPDDYTRWLIIFGHEDFNYGDNYTLTVEKSKLFSQSRLSFWLLTQHLYTMSLFDTSCGGFGKYDPEFQTCICNPETHRAGIMCDHCEQGFDFNSTGTCIQVDTCRADTCGCLTRVHPTDPCIPIGKCIENHANIINRISCECPPRYTGPRCNTCTEGYGNYPICTMNCLEACAHGTCITSLSCVNTSCVNVTMCMCVRGYSGTLCNRCDLGYGGYPVCEPQCMPPCMHGKCVTGNQCVCDEGWSGSECGRWSEIRGRSLKSLMYLALALVVLCVIGAIIFLAWRIWKKRREMEFVDPKMEMELEGGKKFGGGEDDSSIGLGDEDDGHIEIPTSPFVVETGVVEAEGGEGDDDSDDLIK